MQYTKSGSKMGFHVLVQTSRKGTLGAGSTIPISGRPQDLSLHLPPPRSALAGNKGRSGHLTQILCGIQVSQPVPEPPDQWTNLEDEVSTIKHFQNVLNFTCLYVVTESSVGSRIEHLLEEGAIVFGKGRDRWVSIIGLSRWSEGMFQNSATQ